MISKKGYNQNSLSQNNPFVGLFSLSVAFVVQTGEGGGGEGLP